jgi:alkylated DNA repair dioxygenase AlkB
MAKLFVEPRELLPFDGSAVLHEDALSADRAFGVFEELLAKNPWESHDLVVFGAKHREPRLSTWHALDDVPYTYSGLTRQPLPFTPLLNELRAQCEEIASARFNAVLVNLYRDGTDGVGWHADDEPENGVEPVIASVSLGATRRFDLRHRESGITIKTELEHGSVVVMSGLSQHCWVHQIAKTKTLVGPRINLTFRLVVDRRLGA